MNSGKLHAPPLSSDSKIPQRRWFGPALILIAAACATAPILLHGSFCGDDFEFHLVSWFDVRASWQLGVFYPHWMPSVNYGAGEPRFIFYPPLTWMLGAALGSVLPWKLAPVAMVFLFLAATGLAVRALARQALADAPSTLAGCAALFSGFALFTAYERTAFAELMGGFWIPLLILFTLRDRNPATRPWRRVLDGSALPLALVLAGCWLADGPVGVMASYLMAGLAAWASIMGRSWAPMLRATLAAALGIGLPAFYLFPAAWEQKWVDLRAAVDYPVFQIENNWLFARHSDPMLAPFRAVLWRASTLTAAMIAVALLGAVVLLFRHRHIQRQNDSRSAWQISNDASVRRWWMAIAIVPAVVLFLDFPLSLPVWNLLPKLRYLQYPWRLTLLLEAPMAIIFAAAVWPAMGANPRRTNFKSRAAVTIISAILFLTLTGFAAKKFLRVCNEGDTASDLLDKYQSASGLEGADEYEPPGSDHWKIATGLPDACLTPDSDTPLGVAGTPDAIPEWRPDQGSCIATAGAQSRKPEHLRIRMLAPQPGYLILRLLSYPAWRLTVNGNAAGPSDMRDDGLIAVPVPQGPIEVSADWTTTPDVVAGRSISALALLLLVVVGIVERKPSSRSLP